MIDLACVIHLHSVFSDGTGTVQEIAAAARAARVDAVLLTDHDTLEARRQGLEGFHDGVLVLVGIELTSSAGHLLAFGIDDEIDHRGLSAAELAGRVADAGGIAFAAHPFSEGSRISATVGRPHPWTDLDAPGLTGIELWSLETDELEAARGPRELLRFVRAPERAEGPPRAHLARWDELCARRPLVGIGGLDAHQKGVRIRGRAFGLTSYERSFSLLRTHVLAERVDRESVYAALRAGRCYLAVDALAAARGFECWAVDSDGSRVAMGSVVEGGVSVHARVPRSASLVLLRGGEEVASVHGEALDVAVEGPGAHRVEARLGGRTWVVGNPVYVR